MTDGLRDTRWLAERRDGDPRRVALLVPGGGYTPDRPLLHFARAVLLKHGWTTQELWWPTRPPADESEWPAWSASPWNHGRDDRRPHLVPVLARELAHPYLELDGADHGLETDDDPVNSAELLNGSPPRWTSS